MKRLAILLSVLSLSLGAFADLGETYVDAVGSLTLPQGGSCLRHQVGGAALRAGVYWAEFNAVEGEVGWLEDEASLAVRDLLHLAASDLYNRFFGYSRFDPFVTLGARGWIGREGQLGPEFGLGAFYYLTDNWALRADASATLGLDTQVEVDYSLAFGVHYSF